MSHSGLIYDLGWSLLITLSFFIQRSHQAYIIAQHVLLRAFHRVRQAFQGTIFGVDLCWGHYVTNLVGQFVQLVNLFFSIKVTNEIYTAAEMMFRLL